MHDPNGRFGEVVNDSHHKVRKAEAARRRIVTERGNNIPVASHENDQKKDKSRTTQVQEDLDITVMGLVGMPPIDAPDFVESRSQPEALKSGSE